MKEKIIKLHEQGLTDPEISKILEVSRSCVQWWRKKLDLKSNFSYKKFEKITYNVLKRLVNQGFNDSEIADFLKVKKISVYSARKRYNIIRESFNTCKSIFLQKEEKELLIGCLLGDGHMSLSKNSINPNFKCEHGFNQKDYCYWKYEKLKNIGAVYKEYTRKVVDKRTGVFYKSAIVRTNGNPEYLYIYKNLYKNKIKYISEEILKDFSELSLAVLYMDDGTKTKHGVRIYLNGFDKKSIEIFNSFCKNKWNIQFNIHKDNVIYLPNKYLNTFNSLITKYIHPSMKYKLVT